MLKAAISQNDKKANWLIWIFSVIVFAVVVALGKFKIILTDPGFDVHLFAKANAIINSVVAVLLIAALLAVKKGQFKLHKNLMMIALVLSVLFLLSYICSHLFIPETRFGDVDHDGVLSDAEKARVGTLRYIYYIILSTHIVLAAVILPLILFTAYRGLTAQWAMHKRRARYTWPLWFYVAVTGPIVYYMISPYYS